VITATLANQTRTHGASGVVASATAEHVAVGLDDAQLRGRGDVDVALSKRYVGPDLPVGQFSRRRSRVRLGGGDSAQIARSTDAP
jgi:hypothetical protein